MKSAVIVCTVLLAAATLGDANPGHDVTTYLRENTLEGGTPGKPSGVNAPPGRLEDVIPEKEDCGVEDDSDEDALDVSPNLTLVEADSVADNQGVKLGSPYNDSAPVELVQETAQNQAQEQPALGSPYDDNAAVEKAVVHDHSFDFSDFADAAVDIMQPAIDAVKDMVADLGIRPSNDAPQPAVNDHIAVEAEFNVSMPHDAGGLSLEVQAALVASDAENHMAVAPAAANAVSHDFSLLSPAAQAVQVAPTAETPTVATTPPSASKPSGDIDFLLHALAIGDWGVGGNSCCSKYQREGEAKYRDEQAQRNLAYLMGQSAEQLQPKAVIGHGDNFYWNGVGRDDRDMRFANTFEKVYDQPALRDVEWMNVMGNHDYGGAAYICGEGDGKYRPCTSEHELLRALDEKFTLQSEYVSPNSDRWKMPAHYYKKTLTDERSGLTVDVFNVDTNAATNHGAEQVCCQCYGYQSGVAPTDPSYKNCNTVHRGDKMCFGGDTRLYDVCMAKFQHWTDDSLAQMTADLANSTAQWKVVNSHYSPYYHMPEPMMNAWNNALEDGRVQLFLNGHTHAEGIDFAEFGVHYVTNGAGGGIQTEATGDVPPTAKGIRKVWRAEGEPFGYFELSFSHKWLQLQFITFDDTWKFGEKRRETVKGGGLVGYCYLIPKDGGPGRECSST